MANTTAIVSLPLKTQCGEKIQWRWIKGVEGRYRVIRVINTIPPPLILLLIRESLPPNSGQSKIPQINRPQVKPPLNQRMNPSRLRLVHHRRPQPIIHQRDNHTFQKPLEEGRDVVEEKSGRDFGELVSCFTWDHGAEFVGVRPVTHFFIGSGDVCYVHLIAYFAPEDPPCLQVRFRGQMRGTWADEGQGRLPRVQGPSRGATHISQSISVE